MQRSAGPRPRSERAPRRIRIGRLLLVAALVVAGCKLVQVQAVSSGRLSAKAEQQSLTRLRLPARRGTVTDSDGKKLAFSADSKAIAVQPRQLRKTYDKRLAQAADSPAALPSYNSYTSTLAHYIRRKLGKRVDESTLLAELRSDDTFYYVDKQVDPSVATPMRKKYPNAIIVEPRERRQYPQKPVASDVVGVATWQASSRSVHGLTGLEAALNGTLSGTAGSETVATGGGSDSVVIPGTQRDVEQPVPGSDVRLTIDSDLQYKLQQLLARYVSNRDVRAKGGSAAVLDARTGQVRALANAHRPSRHGKAHTDPGAASGDPAVTSPFEPGSVGKAFTAAAAIQAGVVKPDTVLSVPGKIKRGGRVIHDDWAHGRKKFTFTGVLAKSSNVGIDKVARRLRPTVFSQTLQKFGIGQKTGISLPGESAGRFPPVRRWSGSTYANLPFGQGYSMTVLQMASAYQALANGGVRIPPRIVAATHKPGGVAHKTPKPHGTRVVSRRTARTVVTMLRGVTQDAPWPNKGTAPEAAVAGYQVAGKTGTAQQYDPKLGHYSKTKYWTTFAGILPAKHPRYVVAIMLDRPAPGLEGGETAGPLFHDVAAYLAGRHDIPPSAKPTPKMTFVVQ
jgi:cell division protein FtsI (penicillin-binding protein 3)